MSTVPQPISYAQYIHSDEWRAVRERFFHSKLFKGRCQACPSTDRLHVHHLTYKRLGREYLRDLVALCEGCHANVHDRQRATGENLALSTRRFIRSAWMRDLSRPAHTGQWSKRYQRRWQAAHKANV
jgi:5-methylcytosine-specific restriction endonuclease McrA